MTKLNPIRNKNRYTKVDKTRQIQIQVFHYDICMQMNVSSYFKPLNWLWIEAQLYLHICHAQNCMSITGQSVTKNQKGIRYKDKQECFQDQA